jgi:hypothetical protein
MLTIWQGVHLAPAGREGGRERRVERYASFTGGLEAGANSVANMYLDESR